MKIKAIISATTFTVLTMATVFIRIMQSAIMIDPTTGFYKPSYETFEPVFLILLYGFIAVSGLKMIQKTDLEDSANLFTVSVILISGIGGMALAIGKVTITAIACALILGIITNILLNKFKKKD